MHQTPRRIRGYTLIELLIILGIIGVLASLAVPAFVGYTSTAQQSRAMEQLNEIAQGVERYFTENRNYPATLTSISPAPCALCQDDYFNYSLQDVGTSTYTVQALKYNGAARYDLRLDHLGAQSYSTAGTDSWQQGWP